MFNFKLTNQQHLSIELKLNDEDTFRIEYDIWDQQIDITDIWAAEISVYVLLSELTIRDIEAEILTDLKQDAIESYASYVAA